MSGFQFPPLGDTGAGDVLHLGRQGHLYWRQETDPPTWNYYVTLQEDRPACAFRCHYRIPGSNSGSRASAPCDEETVHKFIRWVEEGRADGGH